MRPRPRLLLLRYCVLLTINCQSEAEARNPFSPEPKGALSLHLRQACVTAEFVHCVHSWNRWVSFELVSDASLTQVQWECTLRKLDFHFHLFTLLRRGSLVAYTISQPISQLGSAESSRGISCDCFPKWNRLKLKVYRFHVGDTW